MRSSLLVLLCSLQCATSMKFLAYNPLFAKSHVNFISKISDVLVDAGHEVVSKFFHYILQIFRSVQEARNCTFPRDGVFMWRKIYILFLGDALGGLRHDDGRRGH